MAIKTYGMDDLEAARALQREAVRLHLPCPPVVSWEAKVIDNNGMVSDHRMGKCNSYTRNALNIIAKNAFPLPSAVFTDSGFGDGIVSMKNTNGILSSTSSAGFSNSATTCTLKFGVGTSETLDDYQVSHVLSPPSVYGAITASFDATERKLVSIVSGVGANATGDDIDITEIGLAQSVYYNSNSTYICLTVHDIIDAITVPPGKSLNWAYRFELAYPNP